MKDLTAKEKAIELIDKFYNYVNCWSDDGNVDYENANENAKQCALIAVDEMIEYLLTSDWAMLRFKAIYWQEVKSEIEKL